MERTEAIDHAKRCADQINFALNTGNVGRWVAIRLADGSSDGVIYDTRADAIEHQLHESLCCYIKVPPTGVTVEEASRFMAFNRLAYDNGFRLTDPSDQRTPIMPQTNEEFIGLLNRYGKR